MAIQRAVIEREIRKLVDDNKSQDPDESLAYFSRGLARIIENAIKSAEITIPPGAIAVSTAGTPAAQTGANTSLVRANII